MLRGLDTVEDDMSIPDVRALFCLRRWRGAVLEPDAVVQATKIPALLAFYKNIYKRDFSAVCTGSGLRTPWRC